MSEIIIRLSQRNNRFSISEDEISIGVLPFANITFSNISSSSSLVATYEAAEVIEAYDVVALVDGFVVKASTNNLNHINSILGISNGSYSIGESVAITTEGIVSSRAWSWSDDQALFLGINGQIVTQPDFNQKFIIQLGNAPSPRQINLNISEPTRL